MNIVINRTRIKGEYCEGYLTIDGSARICSTLENANGLAPAGDYPITLVKCKKYARKMPCLNPHPPCDQCKKLPFVCTNSTLPCWCPMIKPGNGVYNRLDGSICVGQYNCLNSLLHPKTTFDPLYERIRKSISRGNQVMLSIKDPPPPPPAPHKGGAAAFAAAPPFFPARTTRIDLVSCIFQSILEAV